MLDRITIVCLFVRNFTCFW